MINITAPEQEYDKVKASLSMVYGGIPETGKSPTVAIQRVSDGQWLQAGGGSWGATKAVNTMTELSATDLPGRYEYAVPAGQLDYAAGLDGYRIIMEEADLTLYEEIDVATKRDGAVQSEILSDATPFAGANVDATVSSRSSHSATDVDTQLSGTHGAGSWEDSSVAGAITQPVVEAVQHRAIRLQLVDPSATTGLGLGDFAVLAVQGAAVLATPTAGLSLVLDEVDDTGAPGYYELSVTPTETGLLFLRLTRGSDVFEFAVQVVHEAIDLIGATLAGAEGDVELEVLNQSSSPVEGALVRIFDAAGTKLVARATTDALGIVTFGLPVGTYQARFSKSGVDFANDNPTTLTVVSNEEVVPIIDGIIPGTASIGDRIAIYGRFFGADTVEVLFGTLSAVAVTEVNSGGTIAVVDVPAGLTDTIIPVRVQKPDPNDLPSGKLISSSVNMTRV